MRLPLPEGLRRFAAKPLPRNVGWLHTLGALLLVYLGIQVVTGILLALWYNPSAENAYDSVRFIREDLRLGSLVLSLHREGAAFVLVVAGLHMLRGFLMAAYKGPRRTLWATGAMILLILPLFPFTGMLLPFDQKGYWATTVGVNILGSAPGIGGQVRDLLTGGSPDFDTVTLSRFYLLHICLLPLALGALAILHLGILQKVGSAGPAEGDSEPTRPFYPAQAWKDVLVACCGALLLFAVAWSSGFQDSGPADPSKSFLPYPEWYFLPHYGLLRKLPASLQQLGTFWLPNLLAMGLILLPWIDRGPERRFRRRRAWNLFAVAGLVTMGFFGWSGRQSLEAERAALAAEEAGDGGTGGVGSAGLDSVGRGKLVYERSKCDQCHTIRGRGEWYGPDLTRVALRLRPEFYMPYLRNPDAYVPGTEMPAFKGSEQELYDLVAYLQTLRE